MGRVSRLWALGIAMFASCAYRAVLGERVCVGNEIATVGQTRC